MLQVLHQLLACAHGCAAGQAALQEGVAEDAAGHHSEREAGMQREVDNRFGGLVRVHACGRGVCRACGRGPYRTLRAGGRSGAGGRGAAHAAQAHR